MTIGFVYLRITLEFPVVILSSLLLATVVVNVKFLIIVELSLEIVLCVKMCENLFIPNDKIIITEVLILSLTIIIGI